jgi:hypothetical protein
MVMITEKDRINTCIEKYGLSKEEATRIVKEDNMILTVEELRLKFDNPNLGRKYPEWLTPTDHYKMCCTTVRQMYNGNFARICTPEDLASTLFIKSSLKLNTFENHRHLKTGLVTMAMGVCRDGMRREKYWSTQTLDTEYGDDTAKMSAYSRIVVDDNEKEARDCLNAVLSIRNREVRELLILAGYIIGGIDNFAPAFEDIISNSEYIDRTALLELLQEVYDNDKKDQAKIENKKIKARKTRITLKSILKIYKTDLDLKSARLEIGEYLMSTGFTLHTRV